jgi:CRP-like cAMP-binding protein
MKTGCHCGHCHERLCIHKVPIMSSLNEEELIKISDMISHHIFSKGEILCLEGDSIDSIIIIHEGSAKAYKNTPDGREQILYVFREGDFFGEHNLFRKHFSSYTVEALETLKTCHLSRDEFQTLLYKYPSIAVKIIDELGNRLSRLENVMQSIGVRNVDSRIAETLLEFASKYGRKEPEGIAIQLPLSREGIANYLGVARETLSRKLSQLEDDNIIRSINNKRILILDYDALLELSGNIKNI